MPWKVSSEMDERLRFIARLVEGEAMTDVCIEFGIPRKTGYKIYDRYKQSGAEALNDRSRRPYRYASQLPPQVLAQIVGLRHDKPHWGARKYAKCCCADWFIWDTELKGFGLKVSKGGRKG